MGPVYSFDSSTEIETKAEQLASCYKTSLQLAVENSLKSIAFPCISTGIYGYPIEDATHVALTVVRDFVESEAGSKLERVIFTIWTQRDKGVYECVFYMQTIRPCAHILSFRELLPLYFPPDTEEAPADAEPTPAPTEAAGNSDN